MDKEQVLTIAPVLSKEEREVLILGAMHPNLKHLTNREISLRLGMPVSKIKTLIHQACIKLGADNKNEAVLLAMRRREINLDELLSLDELAQILCSLDPEALREIANSVSRDKIRRTPPRLCEPNLDPERKQPGILANRERDVLILASYGLTNLEIAERLFITPSAVRTFFNRAFKKLGARKKADAVQLALKKREISVCDISSKEELEYYLAPLGADSIMIIADILDGQLGKGPIKSS